MGEQRKRHSDTRATTKLQVAFAAVRSLALAPLAGRSQHRECYKERRFLRVAVILYAGRAFHPTSPVSGAGRKRVESGFPVRLAGFNGRGTSASLQSGRDDQRSVEATPLSSSALIPGRQDPAAVRAAWVQHC